MGGHGSFRDPRIDVRISQRPDLVTPKLLPLLIYQLTLRKPAPPAGSFDRIAAARGRDVFRGAAGCARCHQGPAFTDVLSGSPRNWPVLHDPAEVGTEAEYRVAHGDQALSHHAAARALPARAVLPRRQRRHARGGRRALQRAVRVEPERRAEGRSRCSTSSRSDVGGTSLATAGGHGDPRTMSPASAGPVDRRRRRPPVRTCESESEHVYDSLSVRFRTPRPSRRSSSSSAGAPSPRRPP